LPGLAVHQLYGCEFAAVTPIPKFKHLNGLLTSAAQCTTNRKGQV
jgi:hypothetical protein